MNKGSMNRGVFFLDTIRVERRALAPRAPYRVRLPLPPAQLYCHLPGRKPFASRDYADWIDCAAPLLAGAPRLRGPVWIALASEAACTGDARAVLDLLLRQGVIEHAGRVRELRQSFGPRFDHGAGLSVTVQGFPFGGGA